MSESVLPDYERDLLVLDLARAAREALEWSDHLKSVVERAEQTLSQFPEARLRELARALWTTPDSRYALTVALDVVEHARAILKEGLP